MILETYSKFNAIKNFIKPVDEHLFGVRLLTHAMDHTYRDLKGKIEKLDYP